MRRPPFGAAFGVVIVRVATVVYVDGFNLYFGSLRNTPYRWLNLEAFAALELPKDEIVQIRYFTARISARGDDTDKPRRQDVYLRALRTLPKVSIHFGRYLRNTTRMALVKPPLIGSKTVEVWKDEEKGSDVNLATYMLLDAFDGRMDTAVVVSNDSDLVTPIGVLRYRFGLSVGVLNPHPIEVRTIREAASFYKPIRSGPLSGSQFPDQIIGPDGTVLVTKPVVW